MSRLIHFMSDHLQATDVSVKATGGLIGSIMLAVPSWMENFEAILRIVSLIGSIVVAVLTATMLIKKLTKK